MALCLCWTALDGFEPSVQLEVRRFVPPSVSCFVHFIPDHLCFALPVVSTFAGFGTCSTVPGCQTDGRGTNAKFYGNSANTFFFRDH